MNIQKSGSGFLIKSKNGLFGLSPDSSSDDLIFASYSNGQKKENISAKKHLIHPGEYEISEILIRSVQQDTKNIIFKYTLEDIILIDFGNITETINSNILSIIGETIDIAFIQFNDDFPIKKIKETIETVSPRIFIVKASAAFRTVIVENFHTEELSDNFDIKKYPKNEEKIDVFFVS